FLIVPVGHHGQSFRAVLAQNLSRFVDVKLVREAYADGGVLLGVDADEKHVGAFRHVHLNVVAEVTRPDAPVFRHGCFSSAPILISPRRMISVSTATALQQASSAAAVSPLIRASASISHCRSRSARSSS